MLERIKMSGKQNKKKKKSKGNPGALIKRNGKKMADPCQYKTIGIINSIDVLPSGCYIFLTESITNQEYKIQIDEGIAEKLASEKIVKGNFCYCVLYFPNMDTNKPLLQHVQGMNDGTKNELVKLCAESCGTRIQALYNTQNLVPKKQAYKNGGKF